MIEYLYSYRTRYGSYDDVWAVSSEHAAEILRTRDNRPTGFYTIYRVTNVPPRERKA